MQIMLISKLFSISDGNCCIHYFSLFFFSSISQNQWKWNVHWTQWKGPSRTRAQCVFSLRVQKSLQKPLQKQLYINNPNGIALILVPQHQSRDKSSCYSTRYLQNLVWKPQILVGEGQIIQQSCRPHISTRFQCWISKAQYISAKGCIKRLLCLKH